MNEPIKVRAVIFLSDFAIIPATDAAVETAKAIPAFFNGLLFSTCFFSY
jgi:hypothetical protein